MSINQKLKSLSMLYQQGEFVRCHDELEILYQANPTNTDISNFLAIVKLQLGHYQQALTLFEELNKQTNSDPDILNNIGVCQQQLGLIDEALRYYELAYKLSNDSTHLLNAAVQAIEIDLKLASSYYIELSQYPASNQALKAYHCFYQMLTEDTIKQTLKQNIKSGSAYAYITNALEKQTEAISIYISALKHYPNLTYFKYLLMLICLKNRSLITALPYAREIHQQQIDNCMLDTDMLAVSAKILMESQDYVSAIALFKQAIQQNGAHLNWQYNLAQCYAKINNLTAAEKNYMLLLQHEPDNLTTLTQLYQLNLQQHHWQKSSNIREKIIKQVECLNEQVDGVDINPYHALHLSDNDGQHFKLSKLYVNYLRSMHHISEHALPKKNHQNSKIHIGYISADFNDHCIALLLGDLFKYHDRDSFVIFAYDVRGRNDKYQQMIKNSVDYFRVLASIDDQQAYEIIQDDHIDFMIDLTGYTQGNRMRLLSYKPALLQAHYLGDVGSQANDYTDYYISMPNVTEAQAEFYTEKIINLPYLIPLMDYPNKELPAPDKDLLLAQASCVFGCFNNQVRVCPQIIEAWLQILTQTEKAVLVLPYAGSNLSTIIRNKCQELQIPLQRIIFCPDERHTINWYLKWIDIHLGTILLPGFTASMLCLSQMIPTLTIMHNRTFCNEVPIINQALGLDDLNASDLKEYIATAVKLATNKQSLQSIKERTQHALSIESPLTSPALYIKTLEKAIQQAVELKLEHDRTDHITVAHPFTQEQ